MPAEHEFPEDWSRISKEETVKHLKYLLTYYKEYDVSGIADCYVEIAGISFFKYCLGTRNTEQSLPTFNCFYINNQKMYSEISEDIYPLCEKLFYICQREIARRRQERIAKTNAEMRKKAYIFTIITTTALIVLFNYVYKESCKNEEIEKQVKQYEQTLPGYLEQKQAVVNYRDSLKNIKTK